jgi:hypothetical protein
MCTAIVGSHLFEVRWDIKRRMNGIGHFVMSCLPMVALKSNRLIVSVSITPNPGGGDAAYWRGALGIVGRK